MATDRQTDELTHAFNLNVFQLNYFKRQRPTIPSALCTPKWF